MCATFEGNPYITIVPYFTHTNASNETVINIIYDEKSSFVRHVKNTGADMNAHTGKERNNKFSLQKTPNRNAEYLRIFFLENNLVCRNTKFQKRKGKLWTYTFPNNSKVQLDYIFINKKCINSALTGVVYSFLKEYLQITESSQQTFVRVLSEISNKLTNLNTTDWYSSANSDQNNQYTVNIRNNIF